MQYSHLNWLFTWKAALHLPFAITAPLYGAFLSTHALRGMYYKYICPSRHLTGRNKTRTVNLGLFLLQLVILGFVKLYLIHVENIPI